MDKNPAYPAAIKELKDEGTLRRRCRVRQCKYLNNIIEQDHRTVKRITHPMLGFKSFWAARCTIAGMEVMHAIRKGQLMATGNLPQTPAEQFYALAA